MITDALHWHRTDDGTGPRGEQCVRYDCIEHPRVFRLEQRAGHELGWHVSYHVEGIPAQHWHTAAEAIAAARENPG